MNPSGFTRADTALSGADATDDVMRDFATAAREWAERPAIVYGPASMSYHSLVQRVRHTAKHYCGRREASGGSSGRVGVVVSHTPDVVDHLLGMLQANVTYCPIDASLPPARKETLATTLEVDRLVAAVPETVGAGDLPLENIDSRPTADTQLPERMWRRRDPAYVLCTSGSTGAPKPVEVSRYALTMTVRALRRLFALTPDDRVLQFASLGWDTCLEEILPALTAGATLVFDDAAHSGSFPPFLRMLAEQRITVVDLPTAFWHELVFFLHEEQAALPESLRLVIIGGERVDPTRLRQWRDLDTAHIRLLNTYGCTETTMVTHAVQLSGPGTEPSLAGRDAEAPIGRPLPHVRDHVTEEGELLVAGPSLATGYPGLPQATASAFPSADHGSGLTRWFRTGDTVTRGDGGLLYSRGRIDEQVKVLGVRVHPAEVEVQLNTHPAVSGAVVVGERSLDRTTLTAYVTRSAEISGAELKSYLRDRMPSQFVPSRVKFVAALAYTTSGKVDRAATRRAAEVHDDKGADR